MNKFVVKEQEGKIIIDQISRHPKDPFKIREFEFLQLTATEANQKITISKGNKIILKSIPFGDLLDGEFTAFGGTASATLSRISKVLKGETVRTYEMSNYSTSTSFSGDVSYIEFPSSPYGDIVDRLEKESVCFGDSSDSTRGTNNTLELRNLSSGCEVKYEITVNYNVDATTTFTFSSPSGQFQSSTTDTPSLNTDSSHVFTGTSSVTNTNEWKLYGSIDSDGGGTYRISRVKITITR